LQRVGREPERGRVGERLHTQLDHVGRVVRVRWIGRIRVGAVRLREQVPAALGIRRVRRLGRSVIVVEEVLVEELAAAVGARPGDEDGRGGPDADVLELRRDRGRPVEHVGSGPWSGAAVEGASSERSRGAGDDRERAEQRDGQTTSAHVRLLQRTRFVNGVRYSRRRAAGARIHGDAISAEYFWYFGRIFSVRGPRDDRESGGSRAQ